MALCSCLVWPRPLAVTPLSSIPALSICESSELNAFVFIHAGLTTGILGVDFSSCSTCTVAVDFLAAASIQNSHIHFTHIIARTCITFPRFSPISHPESQYLPSSATPSSSNLIDNHRRCASKSHTAAPCARRRPSQSGPTPVTRTRPAAWTRPTNVSV